MLGLLFWKQKKKHGRSTVLETEITWQVYCFGNRKKYGRFIVWQTEKIMAVYYFGNRKKHGRSFVLEK